jgi:hypothetical protein
MDAQPRLVEVGLRMLEQRWRVLGKAEPPGDDVVAKISEQIALARAPWSVALTILSPYPEIVTILQDLYPQVLPYLIKGYENSAVHHIAYAVSFMARIALAELPQHEVKPGVIAVLLHDIGSGDSFLPKVTEEMIEKALESEQDGLRVEGIRYRREHMDEGVRISRRLLETYRAEHPNALEDGDVDVILDIVGTHDDCKIPLMETTVNKKWLLRPTREDWIKQCGWEADALWMLCPAGILIDMEREHEEDTPENRKAKFAFNLGLHRSIVELYPEAYSQHEMEQFGFRDGLLYRSATGYEMAMEFKRQVEAL